MLNFSCTGRRIFSDDGMKRLFAKHCILRVAGLPDTIGAQKNDLTLRQSAALFGADRLRFAAAAGLSAGIDSNPSASAA